MEILERILVVEDDVDFASEFTNLLHQFNYTTLWAKNLSEMSQKLDTAVVTLVVLDQFLGGENSIDHLPKIRSYFSGPLIILTNNVDVIDRVIGLEAGADDFIQKTQLPREILARIRSAIRRSRKSAALPEHVQASPVWWVNRRTRSIISHRENKIRLTSMEFDALVYIASHAGSMVPRETISTVVLNREFGGPEDRSVDNLMSRLRSKLRPELPGAEIIRSIRGEGYILTGFSLADL